MVSSGAEFKTNIAFAGLTAAGKTTHSRLLAEDLGYDYVSATDILLEILGIADSGDQIWFTHLDEIHAARDDETVDTELENRLLELAHTRQRTVFDTWALAWIGEAPLVRIWIESDFGSRTRKCVVSERANQFDAEKCRQLIRDKDIYNRQIFRRRHGFDLFRDRGRYDAILCNSHLIPEATEAAATTGIDSFAPIVLSVVTSLLSGDDDQFQAICKWHPREIISVAV